MIHNTRTPLVLTVGVCQKQVISNCNHAYYESTEIESRLTDAEYDNICQQYVALNKIIGNDIELASCRFLR